MSKKLESKLADSVRQAKQQSEAAADTQAPAPKPAAAAKPAARPTASTGKYATQDDQAPKPSLDNPWANLYPARIWPD